MKKLKFWLAGLGLLISISGAGQMEKTFQWIGGPTFVLRLGSFKILTDPMFCPKGDSVFVINVDSSTHAASVPVRRWIAPASFDTCNIDLLLISHPHEDHFDIQARMALSKRLMVVAPAVNKALIESWGFVNTVGLNWRDSTVLIKGDEILMIIAIKALHTKDDLLRKTPDKGNGYMISYFDGEKMYRIYWTGDTVWFDEIAGYASYGKIDLLIPDMGSVAADSRIGRKALNAGDCRKIVQALDPSMITPVHHSTFSIYAEPISALQDTLDQSAYKERLHIIKTGNILDL
jgi:L-ascorbate metabolism protein UlaG (beta-lactamase superfamily)